MICNKKQSNIRKLNKDEDIKHITVQFQILTLFKISQLHSHYVDSK